MKVVLAVGLAGAAGAMMRYSMSLLVLRLYTDPFPIATFVTNLLGTFLLACFTPKVISRWCSSQTIQTAWTTGFLGSFTTFSAFSMETVLLLEQQAFAASLVYFLGSVFGGLGSAWLGLSLSRRWTADVD